MEGSSGKIFCSQCGAALNANDKFCSKCGTAVVGVDGRSAAEIDSVNVKPEQPTETTATKSLADPQIGKNAKRGMSNGAAILLAMSLVFIPLFLFVFLISAGTSESGQDETPEQTAQKNKQRLIVIGFVRSLQKSMRDPDSLIFESMKIDDDATVICTEYRARNGFGGMDRSFLVVTDELYSDSESDWNAFCTKPMRDMLWTAKAATGR